MAWSYIPSKNMTNKNRKFKESSLQVWTDSSSISLAVLMIAGVRLQRQVQPPSDNDNDNDNEKIFIAK